MCVSAHSTSTSYVLGEKIREVVHKYSLRHRKCGVRGYMHELFVSKTRTRGEVRASEGF